MPGRPTMTDVAAARRRLPRAGVDRVPRRARRERPRPGRGSGPPPTSSATRPDRRARLLSRRRTQVLGVAFALGHEFHADLLAGLYRAAAAHDQELALSGTTADRDEDEAVADLLALRCDALLLLGSGLSEEALGRLASSVPTVVVARGTASPGVDVVRTDDVAGARLAAAAPDRARAHPARCTSTAVHGRRRRGTSPRVRGVGRGGRAGSRRHRARRVDRGRRARPRPSGCSPAATVPTGLAVFNDQSAVGLMDVLQQAGLRWPEDVSVVGYDDSPLARSRWARLTTVRQDVDALAGPRRAACGRTGRRTRPARAAGPRRPEPRRPGQYGTPTPVNLARRGKVGVMEYTHLGRSGLSVSRLCLGTMNFGPRTDEPTSHAIMDAAHDAGINFFDTANVYGRDVSTGRTEEIIGSWFAQGGGRREKTVIATKVYGNLPGEGHDASWPNSGKLSALNIRQARRREPAAAADRLHRPLPVPPRRPGHALGRDLAGPRGRWSSRARSSTSAPATSRAGTSPRRRRRPPGATSSAWSASSRSTTCSSGRSSSR